MSAEPAPPRLRLDAGCSDFHALRTGRCYYVDKTAQLPGLIDGHGPLLLTRPRRFGKTLTLDTLRAFLELDYEHPGDASLQRRLFADLAIMEDEQCCRRFMGQHPVIAISFNTVEGENFEEALRRMRDAVADLYAPFMTMLDAAGQLHEGERAVLRRYRCLGSCTDRGELAELLPRALIWLCQMLYTICQRPVYILIDEYDTPLARAWSAEQHLPAARRGLPGGYYASMSALLRGLLHPLLKPQPALSRAIARCLCTGCTRVSRESFFSGANNLTVLDLNHLPTATLMGFTEDEVRAMLGYYGLDRRFAAARRWYNGYRFAGVRIYNPWSIACYCRAALDTPARRPVSYWAHSSGNEVLSHCLHALTGPGLEQLRQLSEGGRVVLPIREELSFDELLHRPGHAGLFTLLYHSGYVTRDNAPAARTYRMRIPNAEVRECFEQHILGLYDFRSQAREEHSAALVSALLEGRSEGVRHALSELFGRYLSFHGQVMHSRLAGAIAALLEEQAPELAAGFRALDDRRPERVYQLYAAGVLSGHDGQELCELVMERELGAGRADLSFIAAGAGGCGCVLEFKKAEAVPADQQEQQVQRVQAECVRAAQRGLAQIEGQGYALGLLRLFPALREVQAYGIGCAGKRCAVAGRRYGRDELMA